MSVTLSNLKPFAKSKTRTYRVGRGNASGHGTYSGKGQKGQRARSGGRKGLTLLALKKTLQSTPKRRGFKSNKPKPAIVNLFDLNVFGSEGKVNPSILLQKGIIKDKSRGVKILGQGEVKVSLQISGCQCSVSAKEKIEKAGGKIL
ncbi:MAG: 50S ribosomal protein L15 [bacterium]|nr:50S ribosomal protein L15 [bacterium]